MLKGNTTFRKNAPETISFFSKKTHFFRFFQLFSENPIFFSGSFWPPKNEHHNFFHIFFQEQCMNNKEKNNFEKK